MQSILSACRTTAARANATATTTTATFARSHQHVTAAFTSQRCMATRTAVSKATTKRTTATAATATTIRAPAVPSVAMEGWIYAKTLRLPNVTFVMIKSPATAAKNVVTFLVPLDYNKVQIKNYLQQLYSVNVISVNTLIQYGRAHRSPFNPRFRIKDSDYKKAFVTVSDNDMFSFPTLEEQRNLGGGPD